MKEYFERIYQGEHLTVDESRSIFGQLVRGELDPIEIAALLVSLKTKGEQPAEIAGAARALLDAAAPFPRPEYGYADSCGTGGSGQNAINISTAVAFVAAAMGIPIVKHGNRSVSSKCGSADVLESLGVRIEQPADLSRKCLDEVGVCFLFAPQYHQGVRFAMPVRQMLGTRTILNLLGPLINPSAPPWQMMGVYDPRLCQPLAETLTLLGCESGMVVHGSGLDEVALHGPTTAAVVKNGKCEMIEITPEDGGCERYAIADLAGGAPDENAAALEAILKGQAPPAHTAAVSLNAGALAWVCGHAETLRDGVEAAKDVMGKGAPFETLQRLIEVSHGPR